jgi:hypothetical protein
LELENGPHGRSKGVKPENIICLFVNAQISSILEIKYAQWALQMLHWASCANRVVPTSTGQVPMSRGGGVQEGVGSFVTHSSKGNALFVFDRNGELYLYAEKTFEMGME